MDVARCECDINMVDGAFGTLGLTGFKHGMIGFASGVFRTERGSYFEEFYDF